MVIMNEEVKQSLIQAAADMEYLPQIVDSNEVDLSYYNAFGISDLTEIVPAVAPMLDGLMSGARDILGSAGGETLYRVQLPKGATHLAHSAKKGASIGAAFDQNNHLVGQASLKPVKQQPAAPRFDLHQMAMAVMMASMNLKLDDIKHSQENIAVFLEQKEKALLEGNLAFLSDIINNYKFNFDKEIYKMNSHVKVLDIKQSSEQSIKLFKAQAQSSLNRRGLFITFGMVKDDINKLLKTLDDYRLSIYMYAFSSYVETLLLENFEQEYLDRIIGKIKAYALEYREIYTDCYAKVERSTKRSAESIATRVAAGAVKTLGSAVNGIAKNDEAGQNMLKTSQDMLKADEQFIDHTAKVLRGNSTVDIKFFVDGLSQINHLFNDELDLFVSGDKLYIES